MSNAEPIRIAGLSHRYGKTVALDGIDLSIPPGRLVGFVGPDGVGKSTLLGLIAGAKQLQTGRVTVLGGDIADADHRRRVCPRIAFMPQGLGRNLYPTLTVRENLEFFARLFATRSDARERRVDHLLAATGLAPFPDRVIEKLSGGMKQKLGLCCALIHDPDLLVLDEPTTGVDPLSRRQFWQLIADIRASRPRLCLLESTAYLEEAQEFEWLVAMDHGQVLMSGTVEDILAATQCNDLDQAYRSLRPKATVRAAFEIPPRREDTGEPVISARGLTKRFGSFTAVVDVSFDIERGEIFGFLGSNGCGKTTTMKMLVGLLAATEGAAELLGRPVAARDREARRDIGYMSQSFSLFGELTVAQNLILHARVFGLPAAFRKQRIEWLTERFGLAPYLDSIADTLPLGVRQRLSLAVAIIHDPRVLILDEPTSGVDPDARDDFWKILIELSRDRGVTIFISTHFMNEAQRCDRVALMHAGRVLACDAPNALVRAAGADSLEEAFIIALEDAAVTSPRTISALFVDAVGRTDKPAHFSIQRAAAYARRETLEVLRDPVRLAFAFVGSAIMMVVFCFGVSLDIEDVAFTAVDLDRSPASRAYIAAFEGSRYFTRYHVPPSSVQAAKQLLVDGQVALMLEIPPQFGRRLHKGEPVEVLAVVDGALPFKGETVEGYVAGIHDKYLAEHARDTQMQAPPLARIEPRFRYNQNFESIRMMAPGMPAMLLVMLPAILTAVSVARERELGSITNLYVTPTTRFEFLTGKQVPYVVIAFANALLLIAMTIWVFGVPLKGSVGALAVGAILYVWGTTAFGLVMSAVTSSQVAAVFATTLSALIPTLQFSGLLQPVSTLEGGARVIGQFWPATYYLHLSVGAFTKGLSWPALLPDLLALASFGPLLTAIAVFSLRAQER